MLPRIDAPASRTRHALVARFGLDLSRVACAGAGIDPALAFTFQPTASFLGSFGRIRWQTDLPAAFFLLGACGFVAKICRGAGSLRTGNEPCGHKQGDPDRSAHNIFHISFPVCLQLRRRPGFSAASDRHKVGRQAACRPAGENLRWPRHPCRCSCSVHCKRAVMGCWAHTNWGPRSGDISPAAQAKRDFSCVENSRW